MTDSVNLWDIAGSKGYYELDEFRSSQGYETSRCLSRDGKRFSDAESLRDFEEHGDL